MGGVSDLPEDPFPDGPEDPEDAPGNPFDAFGGLFGGGPGGMGGMGDLGGMAGGMPMFADLARMLRQQLGDNPGANTWSTARQFGVNVATGGTPEPNVDPTERMRIEELARVAELHVATATGLPVPTAGGSVVEVVTRTRWVERTLDDLRPLLEGLAASLGGPPEGADADPGPPDPSDPFAFLAPLLSMMGPVMVGMTTGSMVGHLAQRSFGQFDLPIPRPAGKPVMVVPANIDGFANDWSLPGDDVRLWVCIHELAHHAVLAVPHVRTRLESLLRAYVEAFDGGSADVSDRLGELDPEALGNPDAMARLLGSPDLVLGALRSPSQEALLPDLEALVAVVVGYVDHVMDLIGDAGLFGAYGQLTEALRRRRVEAGAADRFVERLLGLELTQAQYDRGRAFVDGVVERSGAEALGRLWAEPRALPTPAEVDAPGLWLARLEFPDEP
jgi:putative hydrolase